MFLAKIVEKCQKAFCHFLTIFDVFFDVAPFRRPLLQSADSKNPSKKHRPFKNLLRTLLRSVLLHEPLGVHPIY